MLDRRPVPVVVWFQHVRSGRIPHRVLLPFGRFVFIQHGRMMMLEAEFNLKIIRVLKGLQ